LREGGIVAGVELPRPIERRGPFAQAFNIEHCGCGLGGKLWRNNTQSKQKQSCG
jgi:hypothetical protein